MVMRFKAWGLVLAVVALAFAMAQASPNHADHAETEKAEKAENAALGDEVGEDGSGDGELGELNLDSTTAPALPKSRADSVVLIRHQFNHREQIIAGGVVMACIAAMMAIMNNYNPR